MALWKDPSVKDPAAATGDASDVAVAETAPRAPERPAAVGLASMAPEPMRRAAAAGAAKESLIAADVTIEGKIEGAGDVRIAGRFKGDVNVQGNVTVEQGAHVNGQVSAATVIVSGEVEGNINASARVELLETGIINGDVKAAVLTVAAGSRMRGQADFGWGEQGSGRK
jgi:cytoskeletal protein CcmA (bactofilin family)